MVAPSRHGFGAEGTERIDHVIGGLPAKKRGWPAENLSRSSMFSLRAATPITDIRQLSRSKESAAVADDVIKKNNLSSRRYRPVGLRWRTSTSRTRRGAARPG